jgi:hypothetical protein
MSFETTGLTMCSNDFSANKSQLNKETPGNIFSGTGDPKI